MRLWITACNALTGSNSVVIYKAEKMYFGPGILKKKKKGEINQALTKVLEIFL